MKITVNNEALAALLGVRTGDEVDVKCKHGIPVVKEWRNRFRDAEIDGCISLVKSKPQKEAK